MRRRSSSSSASLFVVVAMPICAVMIASASRLAASLKRSPRVMRAIDWLFAGIFGAFAVRLILTRAALAKSRRKARTRSRGSAGQIGVARLEVRRAAAAMR